MEAFSSQEPEPVLKLLWSIDLGQPLGEKWRGVTIGGNGNLAFPVDEGDHFAQGQGSVYLSFPWMDRLSGFVEYFVIGSGGSASSAAQYVDAGVAYLLDDRVQVDFRVGAGLNSAADNWFIGTGVSFLF